MKFSLWTNYSAQNSKPVFEAFAESLIRAGHVVVYNEPGADKDVIWSVLWSGRMAPNKQIFNKDTIVLEVGNFQRGVTWKVGIGGIDRRAIFGPSNNNNERVKKLGIELQPWSQKKDGPILVCCQNPYSHMWEGKPAIEKWLMGTIAAIRTYTEREIIIRAHPRARIADVSMHFYNVKFHVPQKIPKTYDDFDFNPATAWAIVNSSSNPGVQSIISGIPAFVESKSLAWPVANHSFETIETPLMPDRTQWINDLSYTEWTLEEIQQGLPLARLTSYL